MAFASPTAHPSSMWIAQESAEVRRAVQSPGGLGVWGELVPCLICTCLEPCACLMTAVSVYTLTFKMAYPGTFEGKCKLHKTHD